jgi:hypothetical protein
MLAYFCNFVVPGVSDVVVWRHYNNPNHFYLLNDRPRIARDGKSGIPLFNFTLFSRNIDIAYASEAANQPVESQLGALNMTVDLSVSDEQMALIRQHLTRVLEGEMRQPSAYNKLYKTVTTSNQPSVGYPDWLTGTVRLDMLEGLGNTFKRSSSPETTPTLHGGNKAALWATFGSEGAQLLWGSFHPKEPAGGGDGQASENPMQANITYKLEGLARLPALRVSVTANGKAVYQELRKRTTVYEQVGNSRWTYPQISSLSKELVDNRTIDIKWDDYGIPAGDPSTDQIKQQLEQTVLGVITNQIVGMFFKAFEFQGLKDEDLGTTFTHTTGGKPGSRLWLNDYTESFEQNIGFTMERSQNFRFPAAPQTSLLPSLTPAEREQLVRIIDVGSPEIRVMTVQAYTNADFKGDKVANITATLSYRQFDTLVNDWIERSESFVFKTGEETFTFRTRLARDQNGRLLDFYEARAQINYLGVAQSPPPIVLERIADKKLTFSYDRLGFVKVEVQAGDIDWTQIKDVFIDLVYPPAQHQPDAKGMVHLTEANLKGAWTCSKHGATSNGYQYVVRRVFKTGREETDPPRSDDRGTLLIHDNLVGRLRRTFDAVLDPVTVANVGLRVRYLDPPNEPEETRHAFSETGSWEYVRPLRDGAPQELEYAFDVQYKDGQFERGSWARLRPDQDLPPVSARRFNLPVFVDGEGLDWGKWRVAIVDLTYRDDRHGYIRTETLRINKNKPFDTLPVMAYSPEAREYQFRATLVPLEGPPVEVPADGGTVKKSGVLLLETLV